MFRSHILSAATAGILCLAADTGTATAAAPNRASNQAQQKADPPPVVDTGPLPELKHISIGEIRHNPVALRDTKKNAAEFQELVDSIRAMGVLKPVAVIKKEGPDGKKYELVDGLQRFSASQEAGRPTIPAQVVTLGDQDRIVAQVIANAVKIETQAVEYAKGLMKILGYNPTWTEADLAQKVNKSPAWINKQLGLLRLHDNIKPLVNDQKICVANAYVLAKLPQDEQLQWLERAQTTPAEQFSQQALERAKQIREANRKGQDAGEEKFAPTFHIRKKQEIEGEIKAPTAAQALINSLGIEAKSKNKMEAAVAGFILGLQWVGSSDPQTLTARKQKWEEQRKKNAEDKIRRNAEKTDKRAKEANERATKAQSDAAKAKEAAAKLPAVAEPVAAAKK